MSNNPYKVRIKEELDRVNKSLYKVEKVNSLTRINIKALSINDAHVGRHFPTPEMKTFKELCGYIIPKPDREYKGQLVVYYEFGISSKNADWDNFIKMFQDCLADKYGFNDRQIYMGIVRKVDVNKGDEYISYQISTLPTDLSTDLSKVFNQLSTCFISE